MSIKDSGNIIVVLNGKSYNYGDDYNGLIRDLCLHQIRHYQYQSFDVLRENVKVIMEMVYEFLSDTSVSLNDARKTDLIKRKINVFLKYLPQQKDVLLLLAKIYNFALAVDGIGNLPGFGFSNRFGDKLSGNAERISLRKVL
ncbi:MAG: hypothetical protein PHO27_12255 [Sulfuricurvum sp.]|jgi:hypothetical protein|nr:hypothetical protein [Sulfuricurvum sp.]